MPHLPDHATHDPELIAAFAAGDATGSALDEATALVAECADCAALHRDLRAISTALPELPLPARPRDFRLTPDQADALRPSGWRGLVAAFASPRFRLAAPLGTGLAAAGLAGLLLASPGGLFSAGATTSEGTSAAASAAPVAPAAGAGAAGAPEGNAGGAALAAPAASPAPEASPAARTELDAASDALQLPGPDVAAASAAASAAPAAGLAGGVPAGGEAAATPDRELAIKAESASPDAAAAGERLVDAPATAVPGTPVWLVASAALLLLGVALVVLRVVARRLTSG